MKPPNAVLKQNIDYRKTIGYGFCLILCYLLSGCATQPREPLATQATTSARPLVLAAWDFDNNSMAGGELDYLSKALSEMLLTNLAQTSNIRLVERVNLRQTLEEQSLSSSQLASEESRLKLGRIAGANLMAFGSYMAMGGQIRIDVRVVDVETSQIKVSDSTNATPQDAAQQMQTLAQTIAAQLGAKSTSEGNNATDMMLWKRYEAGVTLMDKHHYEPAIAVFKEILKTNPSFNAAEKQIKFALELQTRQ
jgi:curli biogenesis system outer membrane secretion channel CsgG